MREAASRPGRKPKLTYTRVIVNIPTALMKKFDDLCTKEGFTRQEAIKQAIRNFIREYTPEEEVDPQKFKDVMKNMWLGAGEAAKELQQEQAQSTQPALTQK